MMDGARSVAVLLAAAGTLAWATGARAQPIAKADLKDAAGRIVATATVEPDPLGVRIVVKAVGLAPGVHAFHVHETGTCTPPDFASAGRHFNPGHKEHGMDNPKGSHAGDMPNLVVTADGTARAEALLRGVTLEGTDPNSLFKPGGTALVIHEKPDDMKTDPAGNAGARIACGVIGK
jgi:Cu-Zn family superoxide dismutase